MARVLYFIRNFEVDEVEEPKFAIYSAGFIQNNRHLTFEQRGVYMDLIQLYVLHDEKLPDNDTVIGLLLGCPEREWLRLKSELMNLKKIRVHEGYWIMNCYDVCVAEYTHYDEEFKISRKALLNQEEQKVCQYCGDKDGPFEIDHIKPLSRGGTHRISNLAIACRICNRSKGNKTLEEWMQ